MAEVHYVRNEKYLGGPDLDVALRLASDGFNESTSRIARGLRRRRLGGDPGGGVGSGQRCS
jgi:hypothetical protein